MIQPEIFGMAIVFGVPAAVIVVKTWLTHREKMAGLAGPREQTGVLDARLGRLEQAVESIAIEVERVSEGQRFVTKLLSDRARTLPDATPAGPAATPH